MLALSLEKLTESRLPASIDVRIFLDTTTEQRVQEVEYVRDTYFPDARISHAQPHIELPSGMYNILNSLKQGYETGAEHVFLVEEDVLVRKDFFDWHLEANKNRDYFATCGRRIPWLPGYGQYTNPGSCFHRQSLGIIAKHINNDMFCNRTEYFDREFGKMDEVSDLDDGLIRRIIRRTGAQVLYPEAPKCSHIGFGAYNRYRDWENTGQTIQDKIMILRKMLSTVDNTNRYTRDFEPCGSCA